MKRIKHQHAGRFSGIALLSVFLGGCAVGPNYRAPHTTVASSFANVPTNTVAAEETGLATWWKGFNDPRLDQLLERGRLVG